jgi:hypothetical protein
MAHETVIGPAVVVGDDEDDIRLRRRGGAGGGSEDSGEGEKKGKRGEETEGKRE